MNYVTSSTKNYFICCSDSRKRIIFFFIRLTISILLRSSWSRHHKGNAGSGHEVTLNKPDAEGWPR